jgi:signal transduction histidine kinase/ligand-binding sensor domain-containing protein/AraC-like DNA-binding protein
MKINLKTFGLSFLFILFTTISAQSMDFKRLSIDDGLSNSVVYSITQDSKGLFWFGTRTGVDSYNGSSFNHYNLYSAKNSVSPHAKYLLNDQDENLWVGTTNGLFKYDRSKDNFRIGSSKLRRIQNFNVNKLSFDKKGQLWIGTSTSLYVLIPETDSLIQIREINIPVNDLRMVGNEHCLVATTRGLFKVNTSDFKVGPISSKNDINEIFSSEFISLIYSEKENEIWISTQNRGLYIYYPDEEKLTRVNTIDKYTSSGVLIKDIEYINKSEYLIATDGNGLLKLSKDLSLKSHFYHAEDNPTSLSNNGVYDIFTDKDNRVWIATYGGGVSLYDPNLLPFTRIEHITNNTNSVSNNTGRVIIEDQNKNLWFGTKKGVSIYSPGKNKWKHIYNSKETPNVIGQNTVLTICQVSPEEVWIGSYGGGIDKINTNNFSSTPLIKREDIAKVLGSQYVYDIFKSSDNNIWVGLLRNQLIRYNPQTKEITRFPIINIQRIQESSSGELLLGSREGFYILNVETGEFKLYYHQPKDPSSISNNAVYAILEAGNDIIYIGTEGGGLNIFDKRTGRFTHYKKKDGLPSNTVYGIVKDQNNMIWLSTTNGISVFNPFDKSFTNYDTSDGLHIKEFNGGASYRTSDGKIIFGGTKGFVSFYPDQIKKITIAPKLILTDLKISNRSVKIDKENSPLNRQIDLTDTLTLNFDQNSFSLSFIGLNYTNPVKNQYSWMLDGFEKQWTPRTRDNNATYTNIPPGNYNFKVRSTNVQDSWNGEERNIHIRIRPPFYLTYWAIIIYILIASSITFLIFKFLRIQYEEQHAKEKIQFFVNLAHDLRTPLTLIQSPLSKIAESEQMPEADKQYLDLARKNASKLSQLFNQLLDFQKADLKKMQLQVSEYDVITHLQEVKKVFMPLMDKKSIACELRSDSRTLNLWYDKIKFDKIFFNLISNAIKYTPKNGKIIIMVHADKKNCTIEFIDNGIGIPTEQQKNVFKRYFRATNAINSTETGSGVGLMLIKHIVELHNGQITFDSKPGKGSTFKVTVPLTKTHFQTADYRRLSEKSDTNVSKSEAITKPELLSKSIGKELEESKKEGTSDSKKRPKVVIAEDSDELRNFLVSSLQPRYSVYDAPDGKKALSIIEKVNPDIVISDIMMPEMDGNTLCTHLKTHIETCHIPVILLTALTDTDYKIEGYEAGADAYLEKPFDVKVSISRIENLLKSRSVLKNKFLKYNDPSESIDYKSKLDQEFIKKAVDIVNDNILNSDFSVEEFSKLLYMSRPVLYRKLKALTDQSPQDFIKIIRLKTAVDYLNQTNMSINEVAYNSGFSDPKYFSTCFKKYYGMSPSKYLQR